jgi:hypothetical protein
LHQILLKIDITIKKSYADAVFYATKTKLTLPATKWLVKDFLAKNAVFPIN